MKHATLLMVSLALAVTALAGCSDAPPSGEFATSRDSFDVMGNIALDFQEKVRPVEGQDQLCPPFSEPPTQLECIEPHSIVSGHIMSLPEPSNDGYKLYWTSSAGEEMEIVALMANTTGEGMFDVPETTFDEDYSDDFDTVELRMGDVLIATASNNEGENALARNDALVTLSASATWEGNDLTLTVTGASENVTYVGWLVSEGEDGSLTHAESFPISGNGEYMYTATTVVGDFAEFHVHVAGSKINVAIADIE